MHIKKMLIKKVLKYNKLNNMKIEKNKVVSVTYELKSEGNTIEISDETNPLVFMYGSNLLLPSFEDALYQKGKGDNFEIEIDSKNGYGEFNDYMVINVPKSTFIVDGKVDENILKVGNRLPMMANDNYGSILYGLVELIEEDYVKMNFNHPLAGKDLHFVGKIIDVRDATEEEINEMKES